MEIVVTSDQMRSCDRYAIRTLGMPAALLMENAGRRVAEVAAKLFRQSSPSPVVILCGKGNNGGDGLVAARHLLAMGLNVHVIMVFGTGILKGETRLNYLLLEKISRNAHTGDRLSITQKFPLRAHALSPRNGVIVDALFGTGFRGKVAGAAKKAIQWINGNSAKVVSVDIPSGLDADDGSVGNIAVRADVTVTMGLRKTGLVTGRGPELCGQLIIGNLGFSPVAAPALRSVKTRIVRFGDFRSVLPRRPIDAHKHSVGKILLIAGSVGLTGAAALTSLSAMKAGAGAVILAVPRSIYPILARKLTEVMVKPVGKSDDPCFTPDCADEFKDDLDWADVIVVGPGMSRNEKTLRFLRKLLKIDGKRFLFDADGLNTLAAGKGLLKRLSANECILTPHTGEMARLTGKNARYIEKNRIHIAGSFAHRHSTFLVLKGAPTVTASPMGDIYLNSSGNEGMASAGMGDVLSGIIASLWAETKNASDSAYAGVYLHGLAGDRVAEKIGKRSVTATDVMNEIPYILSCIKC